MGAARRSRLLPSWATLRTLVCFASGPFGLGSTTRGSGAPSCFPGTHADGTAKHAHGVSDELRRQADDLPRLRPGLRVLERGAGVLRPEGLHERAVALPGVSVGTESERRQWRRRVQLRR